MIVNCQTGSNYQSGGATRYTWNSETKEIFILVLDCLAFGGLSVHCPVVGPTNWQSMEHDRFVEIARGERARKEFERISGEGV